MRYIKKFNESIDENYLETQFIDLAEDERIGLSVSYKKNWTPEYGDSKFVVKFYSENIKMNQIEDLKEKFTNKIKQVLSVNDDLKLNKIVVYFDSLGLSSGNYEPGFSEEVWNQIPFSKLEQFENDSLLRLKFNNYYDVLEYGMNEWIEEMTYKGNSYGDYHFIKEEQFSEPLEIVIGEKDLSTDVKMDIRMIEIQLK